MDNSLICKVCGNSLPLTKTGKLAKFCSRSCRSTFHSTNTINKRKLTNVAKYGVDNPMKSREVTNRRDEANLKKYGVKHPFSLKEVRAKQQATMVDLYGVPFATQSPIFRNKQQVSWEANYNGHPWSNVDVRLKRDTTMNERYGVSHPIQSESIQAKIKSTNLLKYGSENPMKSLEVQNKLSVTKMGADAFSILSDKALLEHELTILSPYALSTKLQVHYKTLCAYLKKYDMYSTSHTRIEQDILSILDAANIEYVVNSRSIIPPQELDIFIPSMNKAIECNGSYWHAELQGRGRSYHLKKLEQCNKKGISLFFVWEHLLLLNRDLLLSRLTNFLGINPRRLYARNTTVKEITSNEKKLFIDSNHLQKDVSSKHNYGLFLDNELVSVMTFSKPRFNKTCEFEMIRFCSKCGVSVVGGASKLFTYFTKLNPTSLIVSYSDNQYGNGNLYRILGFTTSGKSKPCYQYTINYLVFENRVKYQKHKLEKVLPIFDTNLSEWENMKNNGYDRIWDCGSTTWVYTPACL